jgi:hypothetical protein
MKAPNSRIALVAAVVMFMPVLAARRGIAQEEPDSLREAYRKAGAPGEAHAFLARMEGTWTSTVTVWSESGESWVSEDYQEQEMVMVMDGRFLRMQSVGSDFMGRPVYGMALTGYNNVTEKYEGIWISNRSTAILQFEGSREGDVLVLHAQYMDMVEGEWVKIRSTFTMPSDNEIIFTEFETRDGVERKLMEIVRTRQE